MMYPEKVLKVELLFLGSERDKALDFVKEFPRFHVIDLRLRLSEMIGYASAVYVDEYVVKLEDAIRRLEHIRIPGTSPGVIELPSEMFKAAHTIHKYTLAIYEQYTSYLQKIKEIENEISNLLRILEIYRETRKRVPLPIPKEILDLHVWIGFTDMIPKDAVVFYKKIKGRYFVLAISDKPLDIKGEELKPELFTYTEEEIKRKIEELRKEIEKIRKALEERKRSVAKTVEALYRAAKLILVKLNILGRGALLLESVYYVEGWVPEKDLETFMKKLKKHAPNTLVLIREPKRTEKPPTLFRTKSELRKASIELTNVYGITEYREINPHRVILITFPLFFGMMFADIAHGLILMLFGYLAKKYADKFPDYLSLFPKGSKMIMYMGFRATIFGALFGDFAGFEIIHRHIGEELAHYIPLLGLAAGDFEQRIMMLQYASLIIAVLHISRGLLLNVYDKIKKGDYYRAAFVSLPRLISYNLFIGPIGYLILLREVISPSLYRKRFPGMKILDAYFYLEFQKHFLILAILIGSLMFPGSYFIAKHHNIPLFDALIEAGFIHFIESFITSLSNTVSYLRLLALNLSHMLLSSVFIGMAMSASNPIASVLIYLTGQILVLVIESISASLHAIRLHRIEFFSKLDLSRSGERFKPIIIRV